MSEQRRNAQTGQARPTAMTVYDDNNNNSLPTFLLIYFYSIYDTDYLFLEFVFYFLHNGSMAVVRSSKAAFGTCSILIFHLDYIVQLLTV